MCYPRRLYDAHKEGNSIGSTSSPKPNACVITRRLTSLGITQSSIMQSSIMQSSIRQSSIKQSSINVLSICTSKQVVEHVSPPKS